MVVQIKTNSGVSPNTVARLSKYLRCLEELAQVGVGRISSAGIAERLNLTPSQVRQDLSHFGAYGTQGYGYEVQTLANGIRSILGIDRKHSVIIVGVGNIGRALLNYLQFSEYNYSLLAGFDNDPDLIGSCVNDIPIYHVDELTAFVRENSVDLCILSVPGENAQSTALMLAENEIPAIWNLTNVDLELGRHSTLVEDVHFLDSLFSLTFYLEASTQTNIRFLA